MYIGNRNWSRYIILFGSVFRLLSCVGIVVVYCAGANVGRDYQLWYAATSES